MRRKITQTLALAKLNTGSAACRLVAFRMLFNLALFRHTYDECCDGNKKYASDTS